MKSYSTLICSIVILMLAITVSGCSVGMALSGKREIDLAALKVGQPRAEVILIAGQPMKTMTTDEGRLDIFECQKGNAPSTGRAVGHAVMDVLTFGGWEIIGTPVEAIASSKFYLTVKYDTEDKVTDIKTSEEIGGLN